MRHDGKGVDIFAKTRHCALFSLFSWFGHEQKSIPLFPVESVICFGGFEFLLARVSFWLTLQVQNTLCQNVNEFSFLKPKVFILTVSPSFQVLLYP